MRRADIPVNIRVNLKLPLLEIAGTWKPDESERKASWEMYAELVTRGGVIELRPDDISFRETLASLDSLFATTRRILRDYGPIVAQPSGGGDLSFGYIALAVLSLAVRPVLATWYPLLQDWETKKPVDISPLAHEQSWDQAAELEQELNRLRAVMHQYATLLEEAAGVPSLIIDRPDSTSHTPMRPA